MFNRAMHGARELGTSFMNGGFEGLDGMIAAQAEQRAYDTRQRAIEEIKAGYMKNAQAPETIAALKAAGIRSTKGRQRDPDRYADDYRQAAAFERGELGQEGGPGSLSLEAINHAMATNPMARYGIIGGAGVAGAAGMTAGAQQLEQLMGLLQEADETEVARDQPLTS